MKDKGNLIGMLVLGLVAGAAIGILMAPDKGSETRKKLMGAAKNLGGKVDLDGWKEKLTDFIATQTGKNSERETEFNENVHSASNPA